MSQEWDEANFLCQLSHKVFNQFRWNAAAVETCLPGEPLILFILSNHCWVIAVIWKSTLVATLPDACFYESQTRAWIAQSVVCWVHCPAQCSVTCSTLLCALVQGIFPLELAWVLTPFPRNSFGWECKPRSSLCTHAFHHTDLKDPDIHALGGWILATKTHPACIIHEDRMWQPLWLG